MVSWAKKRETSLVVGRSDELCIRNSSQRGVPQQSLVRLCRQTAGEVII